MKSVTKSNLTSETIEILVRKNFENVAKVTGIRELGGGMFNSAYNICIHYTDGKKEDFVLKAAGLSGTKTLTYEIEIMKSEVFVYGLLTNTGVPIPKVLKYDFSKKHVDCNYFFMTKLSGKPWNTVAKELTDSDKARLRKDFAGYVAQMHKIKGDYFGYMKDDNSFRFDTWREAYCSMMENIIKDAKRDNIKFPYKKIWAAIKPHLHLLDEVKTPVLVNYDLWAGNIFLIKKNGQYEIEALIDHERGFWGDPYAEFASSYGVYKDIRKEPEMQKAYSAVSGKPFKYTINEEIRIELYRIYGSLLFGAEVYRYPKAFAFFQLLLSKYYVRRNIRKLNGYRNKKG